MQILKLLYAGTAFAIAAIRKGLAADNVTIGLVLKRELDLTGRDVIALLVFLQAGLGDFVSTFQKLSLSGEQNADLRASAGFTKCEILGTLGLPCLGLPCS
jgi:hypothetical protein